MASDSSQYNSALETWRQLELHNEYSVPNHLGTTAIFYTQAVYDSRMFSDKNAEAIRERELVVYEEEAYIIANKLHKYGRRYELIESPTKNDFIEIIEDPQVSSIVTIGSGSLQSLILEVENDTITQSITWRDIARSINHLKKGTFIQRQCGHVMPNCAAVPLGVLAMSDFSKVKAVAGKYFTPKTAYGNNKDIKRITNKKFLDYIEITRLCNKLNGSPDSAN